MLVRKVSFIILNLGERIIKLLFLSHEFFFSATPKLSSISERVITWTSQKKSGGRKAHKRRGEREREGDRQIYGVP